MRTPLRGLLCMSLALCAPAWAGGFCDGEHGSSQCRQSSGAYEWGTQGPILENYSDLDRRAFEGEPVPISFALEFGQLIPHLQQTGARVVVLELTINRGTTSGPTRVLILSIGLANGSPVLHARWMDAQPYWSTAHAVSQGTPLGGTATFVLAPAATLADISIIPIDTWEGVTVSVAQHSDATFMMPQNGTAVPYQPLRLRTGVISATELHAGMEVTFDFYFPGLIDPG